MSVVTAARRGTAQSMSPRARLRDFAIRHRSTTIIVSMGLITVLMLILPTIPPLSWIDRVDPWYDVFANAGVYILLAMGLNVVIGLAIGGVQGRWFAK